MEKYDTIKLPDNLDELTLRAVEKGEKYKRKSKFSVKKLSTVAAIAIVILIGLRITFPALASEIPIVNKILGKNSVFSKATAHNNAESNNLKEIQNYSIEMKQAVTQNGIKVETKELAYDGTAIYLVYAVTGSINTEDSYKIESTLEIQGKHLFPGTYSQEKLDKDTILIKEIYYLSEKDTLPQKLQLSYKIKKIQDQAGNWNFSFNINNINDLAKNVKRKEINKNIMLGSDKAKILSLVESPVYAALTVQFENYKPDSYYFVVKDEEGNEFQQDDVGRIVEDGSKTFVTFYYPRINNNKVSKIIVSQPKLSYFASEKIKNRTYMELNDSLPKDVTIGKDKTLKINKIQNVGDNIELTLETKNVAMQDYVFHGGINIVNKSLNEKDHKAYSFGRAEALGNNTYKVILAKNTNENIKLMFGNYDEVINEKEEIVLNK